jgi:hypothetical protein
MTQDPGPRTVFYGVSFMRYYKDFVPVNVCPTTLHPTDARTPYRRLTTPLDTSPRTQLPLHWGNTLYYTVHCISTFSINCQLEQLLVVNDWEPTWQRTEFQCQSRCQWNSLFLLCATTHWHPNLHWEDTLYFTVHCISTVFPLYLTVVGY